MYEYLDSYSTPENIRQVLSRLEQKGILRRIAHGIYLICDRRSL